ncbi:hypothetical protein E4U43_005167 [Claviceps pusilla]|uniref:Uncharacterized protein n=1 Tax=Claviceps pusilla TaxID=123648 RepID=A0A9P7N571_9HYPO|nr:hypothetical protein E4U43_005167 [Claviceps pusilla]
MAGQDELHAAQPASDTAALAQTDNKSNASMSTDVANAVSRRENEELHSDERAAKRLRMDVPPDSNDVSDAQKMGDDDSKSHANGGGRIVKDDDEAHLAGTNGTTDRRAGMAPIKKE